MKKNRWIKISLAAVIAFSVLGALIFGSWFYRLNENVKSRFAQKRFAPPAEFYSSAEHIRVGYHFTPDYFSTLFLRKAFTLRDFSQSMEPGDYSLWTGDQCRTYLLDSLREAKPEVALNSQAAFANCVVFINRVQPLPSQLSAAPSQGQIIALTTDGFVAGVYGRDDHRPLDSAVIEPELFAQYYGEKPVLRKVVTFASGEVPPMCLNALLAIEDPNFYQHSGVSLRGVARALFKNVQSGKPTQGGSTITQQLVKNYFLSDERTIRRKLTEMAMAFLVEQQATKDEILETYINLIYMGQNGPFEVRGFAAASEHYFGKPLRELGLADCSFLAAVLNGPGVYDPLLHPDRAVKRRNIVLEKMLASKVIDQAAYNAAKSSGLPVRPPRLLTEPAPYFVQAVRRELTQRNIDSSEGLRIYTSLNLRAQEAAQQAVRSGIEKLELNHPVVKKLKAAGKNLEAMLISADPKTGLIESLVGGRGFRATQFNRATDSHRQVGSVMKPFVYLSAFENLNPEGQPYTPLSIVADKATTHKYQGQSWTPKNYEGVYNGDIPIYWALKESINAATVNLGLAVGLNNIIDVAHRVGITSNLEELPSLTLGAFELTPLEVAQAYGTLANMGLRTKLSLIDRIEDLNGVRLYTNSIDPQQTVAPEPVSELVGVMKQTILSGTAQGARWAGWLHPSAGKTGTTNDKKDAWFAGFSPYHVAVVWVGYDENIPHGLTGATGAVPIWTNYMKAYAATFPPDDFPWPTSVEQVTLNADQLAGYGAPNESGGKNSENHESVTLVFKKGQGPHLPPASPSPHP